MSYNLVQKLILHRHKDQKASGKKRRQPRNLKLFQLELAAIEIMNHIIVIPSLAVKKPNSDALG